MIDVITRLWAEYQLADGTDRSLLETEIVAALVRVGGSITLGENTFKVETGSMGLGKDIIKLAWFKVTPIRQRKHDVSAEWTGYRFDRMDHQPR